MSSVAGIFVKAIKRFDCCRVFQVKEEQSVGNELAAILREKTVDVTKGEELP